MTTISTVTPIAMRGLDGFGFGFAGDAGGGGGGGGAPSAVGEGSVVVGASAVIANPRGQSK
jgi:hypothetical protein